MELKFKKLQEDAVLPSYANPNDAGLDLTAVSFTQEFDKSGKLVLVYHTGLSVEIPEGYMGLIFMRYGPVWQKVHRFLGVGQFIPGRVRAEEFFVMLRRKELHGHGVDLAALHAGLLQDHGKVFPRGHPRGKGMARFMRQYVHVVGRAVEVG